MFKKIKKWNLTITVSKAHKEILNWSYNPFLFGFLSMPEQCWLQSSFFLGRLHFNIIFGYCGLWPWDARLLVKCICCSGLLKSYLFMRATVVCCRVINPCWLKDPSKRSFLRLEKPNYVKKLKHTPLSPNSHHGDLNLGP
jgi:hypothetical protein